MNKEGDSLGDVIAVRRQEIVEKEPVQLPPTWLANVDFALVDLAPVENEFTTVLNVSGLNRAQVVAIRRVQNICLLKQFSDLRGFFQEKYSDREFERHLYYETSGEMSIGIWKYGFNRSVVASSRQRDYGKGVYFTPKINAKKSKQLAHVFVCRVLVGELEKGNASMHTPSSDKDTTVDNLSVPSVFVTYKDAQAYPEYLITYI
jgi:poly [ADP-ribose] polymerase 10/14/15